MLSTAEVSGIIFVTILIALDLISGIAKAAMKKEIKSSALRVGLWHKFAYVLLIILAYVIQKLCSISDIGLGFTPPSLLVVLVWVAITEILSVYENLCEINPDIKKLPFTKNN